MAKVGRRSNYDTNIKPYLDKIDEWLNDGATEKQIADALGVAYSSWNNYKNAHPELDEICRKPRVNLVLNLRGSLVTKALGFTHKTKKAMKLKEVIYDNGKRVREIERIEFYDEETYYPPETTAIFGALNIYDPDYVKDKKAYELKREELDLKQKMAEEQLW